MPDLQTEAHISKSWFCIGSADVVSDLHIGTLQTGFWAGSNVTVRVVPGLPAPIFPLTFPVEAETLRETEDGLSIAQ